MSSTSLGSEFPAHFDASIFRQLTGASEAALEDMERFREQLGDWNGRMNLVGPSAMAQFWSRHAFDSAQLLSFAPGATRWADVGTGAGFPGVVLAILLKGEPGAQVHLIESTAKRCRFLEKMVGLLQLPATVHPKRAETLEPPAGLQVVTARACAPLTKLLDYCRPFICAGAVGLFLKGQDVESELTEARLSWRVEADLQQSLSDPSGRVVRIRRLSRA